MEKGLGFNLEGLGRNPGNSGVRIWGGLLRKVYTEHLGGAGSFLGALSEGDFDKVVEDSRPWEEEAMFWSEGTRDLPTRPSALPPSLPSFSPTICLFPLAEAAGSHSWS